MFLMIEKKMNQTRVKTKLNTKDEIEKKQRLLKKLKKNKPK